MVIHKRALVPFVATLMASVSSTAYAQGAAPQPVAEPSAGGGQLEEIIVTAQRREQRLQDVPVSVSVIGSAALEAAGVTNVAALSKVSSSLTLNVGNGPILAFIRGIGNTTSTAGNEGSAAIYVDGIYVARAMPTIFNFNSIERVEVLKGPQGTLFGRNSSAGLINLITRKPTQTPSMEASFGVGNYETVNANVYLSTGVGKSSAIDFTGFYANQNKGWGNNLVTGEEIGLRRDYGFRTKFFSELTDTTNITLSADYINSRRDLPIGNTLRGQTTGNPLDQPPAIIRPLPFYDLRVNFVGVSRATSYSFSGRVDQELPFANLVSITGYRRSKGVNGYDADNTPLPALYVVLDNRARQFSQEFQLQSKRGSSLTWLTGLYYLNSRDGYFPTTIYGTDQGPGVGVNLYGEAKVKSYAAFAQATKQVLPNLNVTLGARYTIDKASSFGYNEVVLVGPDVKRPLAGSTLIVRTPDVSGKKTFNKLTWRGALDYKLSNDVLLFGSVSRGYKAGVYETLPASTTPIRPEVIDAYELGFKSEFLNRRLRVNGSLFWSEIKDPQVAFIRLGNIVLQNAESARSRGAELEIEYAPTDRLRLRFGGTYLDAIYKSFRNAPFNADNRQLVNGIVPGCTVPATVNLNPLNGGIVDFCSGDASGNRLPRAPKYTFNTGFDYRIPMGGGREAAFGTNLAYNSGYFWEPQNTVAQREQILLDAYASYAFDSGRVKVRVWGRNLTQTKYYENAYAFASYGGNFGEVAPPRTYGLAIDMKF